MSRIILQYIRPFLSPIDNMQIEPPLPPSFYAQEIANKIDKMGLPADAIMKAVKEGSDTYITGSFMLHYLLGSPTSWQPNDIDIFTTDTEVRTKIKGLITTHEGVIHEYVGLHISCIHELILKDTKCQIITLNQSAAEVIDKFDIRMLQVKFEGYNICMNKDILNDLITKRTRAKFKYTNKYDLERTLNRITKYNSRGIKVELPSEVFFTEDLKNEHHYLASWENVTKFYVKHNNHMYKAKDCDCMFYDPYENTSKPLYF